MKEQQQLGIQSVLEEETEGKRNKGEHGKKAGLLPREELRRLETSNRGVGVGEGNPPE